MCTWLNRRARLTVVVGLGVTGLVMLAGLPPSLAGGASGQTEGFVLLSMEQAARYRGTQVPYCCTGTATRSQCVGSDNNCNYGNQSTCTNSVGRDYPATAPTYCIGWRPCGTGGCDWEGLKLCYKWWVCEWIGETGPCRRKGWTTHEYEENSDVCTTPTPEPDPQPDP